MSWTGDLKLSTRFVASSAIALIGFCAVGITGGYTIYSSNQATEKAVRLSQSRAASASKAQAAILMMGKAQAQLVAAFNSGERRDNAVAAIKASSTLDESIQNLQQDLAGSEEVSELSQLLREIEPAKMRVIKAVAANANETARSELQSMQRAMTGIEAISGKLVQEENDRLLTAVVEQGLQAKFTLRVLGAFAIGCVFLGLIVARQLRARSVTIALVNEKLRQRTSALDTTNARLSAVLDAATQISIIATDPQGMITVFNSGAERMLGHTAKGVVGRSTPSLFHLKAEIEDRGRELSEQCGRIVEGFEVFVELARQGSYDEREWTQVRRDGGKVAVSLAVTALRDAQEELAGFLWVAKDVTERKHVEEELKSTMQVKESLHLQTIKLVAELTARSEKSALLAKMGKLLQSCNTTQEALDIVSGFGPRMLCEMGGAILLLNTTKNQLEVAGVWKPCCLSSSVFEATSCWALRTGHHYLVEPGERSAHCAHAEGTHGAYLCIPIQAHGDALGVIHFQSTGQAGKITEQEVSLAETFAEQIGLSIANIRLREALGSLSIRDPLTNLFNRRYLEETLEREVHRAARSKQSLGVIMVDIDHFKRFNDSFGHDAGDLVLREVASLFAKKTRAEDIACRYGGEEFVLILPTAELPIMQSRAEQLRLAVKDLNLNYQGKPLGAVTISLGVALFPQHGVSPAGLMARADVALYQAKKNGRDRVILADNNGDEVPSAVSGHRVKAVT
jgi:diguanylate cyclase (GGDEF)-like protein/PAS domain S-box-containing protein